MQYRTQIYNISINNVNSILSYKDLGTITPHPTIIVNNKNGVAMKWLEVAWHGAIDFNKDTVVGIREESDIMKIKVNETHKYNYQYLSVGDMPILFLVPHSVIESYLPYSIKDDELAHNARLLHAMYWINKYKNSSPFLMVLSEVLPQLYEYITEIVYDAMLGDIKYEKIPIEVIEKIKQSFFKYYYKEAFNSVVKEIYYPVWQHTDLVEKRVQEELEKRWRSDKEIEKVEKAFNLALAKIFIFDTTSADYYRKKTSYIIFHNKLASIIRTQKHRMQSESSKLNIYLRMGSIARGISSRYANGVIAIDTPQCAINWLFGTFIIVNRWKVLRNKEQKLLTCDTLTYSSGSMRPVSINNVYSIEVEYEEDKPKITSLSFEFVSFEKLFPNFETDLYGHIEVSKNQLELLLKNWSLMLKMIIKANLFALKVYNYISTVIFNNSGMTIIGCGCLLPFIKDDLM